MFFCRSSILNDSTTIFMVFQVLEAPWKTINPPKLILISTLKPCIDKTPSKVRFVSKNDVSSPLKLHPRSLKIEVGSPRRASWRMPATIQTSVHQVSGAGGRGEAFRFAAPPSGEHGVLNLLSESSESAASGRPQPLPPAPAQSLPKSVFF